jgi:hypothetical protein
MHTIRLNIQDDIFEKFMGLVDILPKGSIVLEEVDEIPHYPSISFEEAQSKVANAVADISKGYGKESNEVFDELFGK